MDALIFMGVVVGVLNCILVAVVIFIVKQPDPHQGRQQADLQEIREQLVDLSKHVLGFEKKIENLITESKNENLAKLDRVKSDVGRQLQDIHDNL